MAAPVSKSALPVSRLKHCVPHRVYEKEDKLLVEINLKDKVTVLRSVTDISDITRIVALRTGRLLYSNTALMKQLKIEISYSWKVVEKEI